MLKLYTYSILVILIASLIIVNPHLCRTNIYETKKATKMSRESNSKFFSQNSELNIDFYETISEVGKLIAKTLSKEGYKTSIYFDKSVIISTNIHLIIIGHGTIINNEYTIEGLSPEYINQQVKFYKKIALLSCDSREINIETDNEVLSFEGKINIFNAVAKLSEFLDIPFHLDRNLEPYVLWELDPGGGDNGDQLGEGWTSLTASTSYGDVWYYFNLETATGAVEYQNFLNEHMSVYLSVDMRGSFNYRDSGENTYGYIEYEDGDLLPIHMEFKVKLMYKLVDGEYHKVLIGYDYEYNGHPDPNNCYTEADTDDNDTRDKSIEIVGTLAKIFAGLTTFFGTAAITFFIASLAYTTAGTATIVTIGGIVAIEVGYLLTQLSLVCTILCGIFFISLIVCIILLIWYLCT